HERKGRHRSRHLRHCDRPACRCRSRVHQEDAEDPGAGVGDRSSSRQGSCVMGIPVKKLKKRWMKEPGFKAGYDALEEEFSLASMLIEARTKARLSQAELAAKMGTSQSTIARLESGTAKPSLSTLERFAEATGMRVRISLEPAERSRKRKP